MHNNYCMPTSSCLHTINIPTLAALRMGSKIVPLAWHQSTHVYDGHVGSLPAASRQTSGCLRISCLRELQLLALERLSIMTIVRVCVFIRKAHAIMRLRLHQICHDSINGVKARQGPHDYCGLCTSMLVCWLLPLKMRRWIQM